MDDIDIFSEESLESSRRAQSITIGETIKGKKVYQSKTENISKIQNADNDKYFKSSFEADDALDNVLSGESLYKTFTFEQSSNEEDVEKCISFWKSVMQKNLEPIKCTIIENSKIKQPPEPEKEKSLDISETELIKNAQEKVHKYYRSMWANALKELQRRKLDQIKLIGKSRCKMCESIIPSQEDTDSGISKEEIVELNEWKPDTRTESKLGSLSKRLSKKRTSGVEPPQKSVKPPRKTTTCVCKPPPEIENISSKETITDERVFIPIDSTRYKLIDLIKDKKKAGAYSHWRKTMQSCTCGAVTCDCNVNPAIMAIKQPTCGCGQLECKCKIISDKDRDDIKVDVKPENTTLQAKSVQDIEEELVRICLCGNEDCTCSNMNLEESKITLFSDGKLSKSSSSERKFSHSESQSSGSSETKVNVKIERVLTFPVKKNSKADVTKCAETDSQMTLDLPIAKTDREECTCKRDCVCLTEESEHEKETIPRMEQTSKFIMK